MREKGSIQEGEGSGPSRCADVLQGTLQRLGFGRVIHHLSLLRAWERAISPRVRERATVEDFRDGRLYVCVEDPIWLHELHMLRHKLKTILNEEVGESVVREIVLRIGRTSRSATPRTPSPRVGRKHTVSTGAEARVQQLLISVKDLPCRDALERLLNRWAARSV